ncbi:hypothetical protein [Rhodopseudomonas parapalustris]
MLLLVTCATIASCDDFDDIAAWGNHHIDLLQKAADFHHAIPYERWLRCWSTGSIRSCSRAASRTGWRRCGPGGTTSLPSTARPHVGPTTAARGSKACTRSRPTPPPPGWCWRRPVPEKANKITAIPGLLDQLAEAGQLEGAL